jgi:hypothetical protein
MHADPITTPALRRSVVRAPGRKYYQFMAKRDPKERAKKVAVEGIVAALAAGLIGLTIGQLTIEFNGWPDDDPAADLVRVAALLAGLVVGLISYAVGERLIDQAEDRYWDLLASTQARERRLEAERSLLLMKLARLSHALEAKGLDADDLTHNAPRDREAQASLQALAKDLRGESDERLEEAWQREWNPRH